MHISIYTHEVKNAYGKVMWLEPEVSVEYSPKEGYIPEKVAKLEADLQEMIVARLNEALMKDNHQ